VASRDRELDHAMAAASSAPKALDTRTLTPSMTAAGMLVAPSLVPSVRRTSL
jgi:hypothetical protein